MLENNLAMATDHHKKHKKDKKKKKHRRDEDEESGPDEPPEPKIQNFGLPQSNKGNLL